MISYSIKCSASSVRRSFRLTILTLFTLAACIKYATHAYGRTEDVKLRTAFLPTPYFQKLHKLQPLPTYPREYTVNLVVAARRTDDVSWTSYLPLPNLTTLIYRWDDADAPYPSAEQKGNEAMVYHTYLHDFYDKLPDITIFVHAPQSPRDAEPFLFSSLVYTLSHLDLEQVMQRQYVNLRTSWQDGCSAWLNTNATNATWHSPEEVHMRQMFLDTFVTATGPFDVPEILAQPCCSQFAVSREAVSSVDKAEYARHIKLLSRTDLPQSIPGRAWEYMWQYLFLKKAIDCPIEWKALCKTYHVCFERAADLERFMELQHEKESLIVGWSFWTELLQPERAAAEQQRLKDIEDDISIRMALALTNGLDAGWRASLGDVYTP
ncbi:hypothetical protein BP5796_04452 [Coleophoma crateriformis]|uniref:Uncharacterized protein n=1 Tax=Coleophoma crateriformis TaxID=565419 RepID=A0A3D8SA06_9HELO|nr:hypothetical protein BP5796_04452 [Coleophoma crateriformis]